MGRGRRSVQLLKTHDDFEAKVLTMPGCKRSIRKSCRGVPQHVVENGTAILCWPVSYGVTIAPAAPTVRYVSLETASPYLTTEVCATPSRPPTRKSVLLEGHTDEDGASQLHLPVPTVRYVSLYDGFESDHSMSSTGCADPLLG